MGDHEVIPIVRVRSNGCGGIFDDERAVGDVNRRDAPLTGHDVDCVDDRLGERQVIGGRWRHDGDPE